MIALVIILKIMQLSQCNQLIASARDYHEALVRNGYRVPALNSAICTLQFLQEVREKKVYTPLYSDLVIRPCPSPPTKFDLTTELVSIVERGLANLDQRTRPPY